MSDNNIVGILRESQVFEGLGNSDLEKIADGCIEHAIPMGTLIIEENDAPKETLYFIRRGEISVSTSHVGADGVTPEEESFITTLGAGDAFGEISIIDKLPHSAAICTISDCAIIHLPALYLNNICTQNPTIGMVVYRNIAKIISQRLRLSNFSAKHFWCGS